LSSHRDAAFDGVAAAARWRAPEYGSRFEGGPHPGSGKRDAFVLRGQHRFRIATLHPIRGYG
jgi:hypothetical protein